MEIRQHTLEQALNQRRNKKNWKISWCREEGTFCTVGGNADSYSHCGKQKIKNGSACCTSNPTSGNISEGTQNTNSKEHNHPCVHGSIIYDHQGMEAVQVSISRWVDKTTRGDICTMEFYSAIKKEKILPFTTVWMDLENIMPSEISQSEKDKYHMISLICGI